MWGLYWGILAWGHGSTAWTSAVSKWFITWHLDQTCLSWIYWLLQTKPRTEWKPIKRFQFNSGLPCHIEKIIYLKVWSLPLCESEEAFILVGVACGVVGLGFDGTTGVGERKVPVRKRKENNYCKT